MTIEDKIAALLLKADSLRPLPDDDPQKAPLTGIVDEINALREMQSKPVVFAEPAPRMTPKEFAAAVAEKYGDATEEGADAREPEPEDAPTPAELAEAAAVMAPKRKPGRPKKAE